jgi:hypothetical protein
MTLTTSTTASSQGDTLAVPLVWCWRAARSRSRGRMGVSRQSVHGWVGRYLAEGFARLGRSVASADGVAHARWSLR